MKSYMVRIVSNSIQKRKTSCYPGEMLMIRSDGNEVTAGVDLPPLLGGEGADGRSVRISDTSASIQ